MTSTLRTRWKPRFFKPRDLPVRLMRSLLQQCPSFLHGSLLAVALLCTPVLLIAEPAQVPEVIAYVFPNLPDGQTLQVTQIHANELTRINYAFALITDGRIVEGSPNDAADLALLRTLRTAQPSLKLLVSVGGWLGSGGFSDAASSPASRRRFVESALAFVHRYDLNGLDLDWEYPGQPGAGNRFRPEDGANFNLLLRELRSRFNAEAPRTGKPLLLTIAAGASASYLQHTTMAEAQRYLDSVNLMAYDFYEPGDGKPTPTGNHAPLYADPADPHTASGAAAIQAFQQAGVPANKLVLGVPFYGHLWGNVSPANHGLFQTGTAVPNAYTSYSDIPAMLANGFTRYWDEAAQVPFAYNETTHQFLTYEDPTSLAGKCAFVLKEHLGGIMFWQSFSDSSGALLGAIHTHLNSPPSPPSAESRP